MFHILVKSIQHLVVNLYNDSTSDALVDHKYSALSSVFFKSFIPLLRIDKIIIICFILWFLWLVYLSPFCYQCLPRYFLNVVLTSEFLFASDVLLLENHYSSTQLLIILVHSIAKWSSEWGQFL